MSILQISILPAELSSYKLLQPTLLAARYARSKGGGV